MKNILFVGIACALAFTSCKKKEETPTTPSTPATETLVALASSTNSNNEVVTLFAKSADLKMGYNKMYVEVKNASGTSINNAAVTYMPMMDMGMMQHTCPVEQPVFNTANGKYEGVVIFIMSSMGGTWTLDVDVNGSPVTFALTIGETSTKVVGSYAGTDGSNYIVSLVPPTSWTVGMNDYEITIHKRESMMSFPADNDFTIVLDPEMVSMGHGSPNNVSPVSIGNGHYKGTVNLTMTGDWKFNQEISKSGTVINANAYLDILF